MLELALENLAAGAPFALLRVLVLALLTLEPLVQRLGGVANVAGCSAITHNLVNLGLLEFFCWVRQWCIDDEYLFDVLPTRQRRVPVLHLEHAPGIHKEQVLGRLALNAVYGEGMLHLVRNVLGRLL